MVVYLRSGGKLRDRLKPDVDEYTRRLEISDGLSLREILRELEIPAGLVAFAFGDGKLRRLDYRPRDGTASLANVGAPRPPVKRLSALWIALHSDPLPSEGSPNR